MNPDNHFRLFKNIFLTLCFGFTAITTQVAESLAGHTDQPTPDSHAYSCNWLSVKYIWTDGSSYRDVEDWTQRPFVLHRNDNFIVLQTKVLGLNWPFKITYHYDGEIYGHQTGKYHNQDGTHGDFGPKFWFFNDERLHIIKSSARTPKTNLKGDHLDYKISIYTARCSR